MNSELSVKAGRKTASDRLLELFQSRWGEWIPLPRILDLNIAQYNSRIRELRKAGYVIENKTENEGRARHSWFRYWGKPTE